MKSYIKIEKRFSEKYCPYCDETIIIDKCKHNAMDEIECPNCNHILSIDMLEDTAANDMILHYV